MLNIWLALPSHNIAVALPRKCASTSVALALEQASGVEHYETPQINPALGPYSYADVLGMGLRRAMFIRHPKDRLESFWRHVIVQKGARSAGINEAGYDANMTFEECVLHACANPCANEHTTPFTEYGSAEFYGTPDMWPEFCAFSGIDVPLPQANRTIVTIPVEWTAEMTRKLNLAYYNDILVYEATCSK